MIILDISQPSVSLKGIYGTKFFWVLGAKWLAVPTCGNSFIPAGFQYSCSDPKDGQLQKRKENVPLGQKIDPVIRLKMLVNSFCLK